MNNLAAMKKYGLIGYPLKNTFSVNYFTTLFAELQLHHYQYSNYAIENIEDILDLIQDEKLSGFNVTIPYKQAIIPFLNTLDDSAKEVGAVNCVKINNNNEMIGFNTDVYGFQHSIQKMLKPWHQHALILGDGGASKAVEYAFKNLGITTTIVSRKPDAIISYSDIDKACVRSHQVIVNCTPVGMYPNTDECIDIPYDYLTDMHLVFDLIYLPEQTLFLNRAKHHGAVIKNGLEMLHLQAQKSWEIWNENK